MPGKQRGWANQQLTSVPKQLGKHPFHDRCQMSTIEEDKGGENAGALRASIFALAPKKGKNTAGGSDTRSDAGSVAGSDASEVEGGVRRRPRTKAAGVSPLQSAVAKAAQATAAATAAGVLQGSMLTTMAATTGSALSLAGALTTVGYFCQMWFLKEVYDVGSGFLRGVVEQ